MADLLAFVLASFACFRLAELITVDDGPGDALKFARAWLGAYDLDDDGQPKTSLGRGIICPYCVGIWLAFFIAFAIAPLDWRLLLWWFAIAGGASFLQHFGRV